jgi:hypothetical protein
MMQIFPIAEVDIRSATIYEWSRYIWHEYPTRSGGLAGKKVDGGAITHPHRAE